MNLRKTIKTRTFYDDKDYRDPHQDEVYRTPPKPAKQPAYQGQVVEFNPDLRPAAFPTIPLGHVVEKVVTPTKEAVTRIVCESPPTSPSRLQPPTAHSLTVAPESTTSGSQAASQSDESPRHPSQASRSVFDVSGMLTSLDKREWSRKLAISPDPSPSPDRRIGACGVENPVYARNMEIMERMSKRTDEDWVEAEMVTSEDEDEDEEPRGRQTFDNSRSAWDKLSVALQLDLIDSTLEKNMTLEAAFKALRLKPRQKLAALDQLRVRNQYLNEEGQVIKMVREETDRRLLTSNKRQLDHFLKRGHRRLIKKYLYTAADRRDYLTANGKDVALAKAYLETCGISLNLDHWANALSGNAFESAEQATSAPSLTNEAIAPEASQPGREVARQLPLGDMALPASAFSIPPRQDISKRTPLAELGIPAIDQPMPSVQWLKLPPKRRRSTHTQAKPDMNGTQEKVDPTLELEPDRAATATEDIQARPEQESAPPPRKESYQPPALARPFTLPPQLSTHQNEWLSNGRLHGPSTSVLDGRPAAPVPNMLKSVSTADHGPRRTAESSIAVSDNTVNTMSTSNVQFLEDPDRRERTANADVLYTTTPQFSVNSQTLHNAPERHMPHDPGKEDALPRPSLTSLGLANGKPPRPVSTNCRPSRVYPITPPTTENPYALAYHTANYLKDDAFTTQQQWETVHSHSARPARVDSVSQDHQELEETADTTLQQTQMSTNSPSLSDTTPAVASGKKTKGNAKRSATAQDEDGEYVPVKKGRKMLRQGVKKRVPAIS